MFCVGNNRVSSSLKAAKLHPDCNDNCPLAQLVEWCLTFVRASPEFESHWRHCIFGDKICSTVTCPTK